MQRIRPSRLCPETLAPRDADGICLGGGIGVRHGGGCLAEWIARFLRSRIQSASDVSGVLEDLNKSTHTLFEPLYISL